MSEKVTGSEQSHPKRAESSHIILVGLPKLEFTFAPGAAHQITGFVCHASFGLALVPFLSISWKGNIYAVTVYVDNI